MSFITKNFSATEEGIIKTVGDTLDKTFTSDEDKMELDNEIAKATMLYEIEMEKLNIQREEIESKTAVSMNQEVTKRWISDNNASTIQKLARPFALYFLLITYCLMAFSATWLEIRDVYAEGYQNILMVVIAAYFGARTIEKVQGKSGWETTKIKKK
jgi:hypothetical protein